MVAPPKMKSKGRSSSASSLSRKMSKFGSALGGGSSKKSSSSSASAGASVGKQKAAAASNDTTDATRKLQAAIDRRTQRRGNKQKVTDLKKFSTSASSSNSNLSSNDSKDADGADSDRPQSKYLSNAPTLYADPSIDALTIPTASSSHSHDSHDTHQTTGSANSASSTDSLNALARENTPHKKKKSARGVHVVGSTPGRISTTFNANRVSGDDGKEVDGDEKDDCKDMFTPIVPRKKGRPPKRISDATDTTARAGADSADGDIMNVAKVTLQQSASNDASTARSFATVNTRSTSNHDRYKPAEQLLERAKVRNEEMQRKQMEEERAKKERQDRYQALSQLLNAEQSEATLGVDNTNVFHAIDANSAVDAAPINVHGVVNRSKNGTPYVPKTAVPPPALSYSYSASSDVTYRSPTAADDIGDINADPRLSNIDRTASQASSVTQPLYASQSLNVNGADDRVRYVRFTDVVTTFDDSEKKRNTADIRHPVEDGDAGQPYESPFVKMHSVQHNYVGGEENRSEFEIELERKMMEHDIEVKRVGYHAQVSTTTTSMQLSQNESAIQAQQRQEKAPSPNFANPLSPDGLLDGANGTYSLHVDHREITYGHKKGSKRTITGKETKFVQDRAAGGAIRSPTITQTTEGFIELEAPEAAHTEYLLRKPTLSFGSQTAVSDVTASTIRHTNTGDYSSIDGDAEAKEYMYARATANTFKPPNARANGGAMQQPQPSASFFGGLADSMTQRFRDCVQPSYHQAVLQSPPPLKMAPPAGIGERLRDCIAPRREFMVHSPHHGTNKGMMSI